MDCHKLARRLVRVRVRVRSRFDTSYYRSMISAPNGIRSNDSLPSARLLREFMMQ